ncbi:RICIN domain-containing protein [Catenuloplanes japonicus]
MLGSIAALATSVLAFPGPALAANPDQISNPMQTTCLQPQNASISPGVLIVQAACDGSPIQRWTRSGPAYVNNGSGLCLNAAGPAIVGHIQTIQSPCNTSSSQSWVPTTSVPGAVTGVKSQLSGNRCLERAGGAWIGNGAWLSPCNGTLDQQWLIPSS